MRIHANKRRRAQNRPLAFVKTLGTTGRFVIIYFCFVRLLQLTTQRLHRCWQLAAMPRFDCTTAAGMRYALKQTHRSGLLDLPEAMLNEVLSQLGIKYLRRFSFASKYALARARARIAQLPDRDWRLFLGDPRSQATVYYSRQERMTGFEWHHQYEQSVVLWDAAGGMRCFPRKRSGHNQFCQACVTRVAHNSTPCCGAPVCRSCACEEEGPENRTFRDYREHCILCGSAVGDLRNYNGEKIQYLLGQLRQHASAGHACAQFELGLK